MLLKIFYVWFQILIVCFVYHKMAPKPGTAGGSYPTGSVSTYQSMGAAGGFNMSGGYEDMNATVNHDYNKYMNPQTGKLSVGGSGKCFAPGLGLLFSILSYSCGFN